MASNQNMNRKIEITKFCVKNALTGLKALQKLSARTFI